ncbi:hypothetical protein FA09DRAFT_81 [Tilletiopsis washingtonensis]|uniref:Uncharacterized protein n=1 Tax=Tilletiopsis washingtonensis TaxID=58919 RepID=A0A316ZKX0_9BASI|nr:hypothetical protein FA09DRAFT_81 [Tilletiopsis washingtonensis]PWO01036.1 hypothetical protein FA09DRAFT_81 [Tilletiopsis washingtonensis]
MGRVHGTKEHSDVIGSSSTRVAGRATHRREGWWSEHLGGCVAARSWSASSCEMHTRDRAARRAPTRHVPGALSLIATSLGAPRGGRRRWRSSQRQSLACLARATRAALRHSECRLTTAAGGCDAWRCCCGELEVDVRGAGGTEAGAAAAEARCGRRRGEQVSEVRAPQAGTRQQKDAGRMLVASVRRHAVSAVVGNESQQREGRVGLGAALRRQHGAV